MKTQFKFAAFSLSLLIFTPLVGCSDDKDEPDKPDNNAKTSIIGFQDVDAKFFGGPTSYGANLYPGTDGQITTGYLEFLGYGKYAQFSINFGLNYDANFTQSWCYTFYNGGIALSNFHDMEDASYLNQLSVYDTTSPSGGNFAVANGFVDIPNPYNAKYCDYEGCAKVYITDSKGYAAEPGIQGQVSGKDESGWFKSVWINNTTYTYQVMKNGNGFGGEPLENQKGWYKVQFIAFEDDDDNRKPLGYTEAYLANFDENLKIGYTGIIDEWIKVDLSSLPECSILVINFVGSDNDPIYGLNTPAYCALDNFEIIVEE